MVTTLWVCFVVFSWVCGVGVGFVLGQWNRIEAEKRLSAAMMLLECHGVLRLYREREANDKEDDLSKVN